MLAIGALLLFVTAPVLWAASYLPFFGVLAFLPFSDVVLAGIALCVAGLLPAARPVRMVVAVLGWAALSLCVELPRWNLDRQWAGGVISPVQSIAQQITLPPGNVLSVGGDAGALLSAQGPRRAVRFEINVAGMRDSAGALMFNRATVAEPAELLWMLGAVPEIGGAAYPRVVFERRESAGWTHLALQVQPQAGAVSATFRRSYPLPPPEPGIRRPWPERLVLGVLHQNLLRTVLGLNAEYSPRSELAAFFRQALRLPERLASGWSRGTLRPVRVLAERQDVAPAGRSAERAVLELAGARDWHDLRSNPCGLSVEGMEFGASASRTYVSVIRREASQAPMVLNHIEPGHATVAWYCEQPTGRLIGIMGAPGQGRGGLRVTGYSREGRLEELHFLDLPFPLPHHAAVLPGTLRRGPGGALAFTLAASVQTPGERGGRAPAAYRVVDLEAAPLR